MQKRRSGTHWKEQVEGWKRSGLSGAEYARREGLNAGVLYAWKHRLKGQVAEAEKGRPSLQFVPARVVNERVQESETSTLEIVLSNGRVVRVRGQVSRGMLVEALRAAEADE